MTLKEQIAVMQAFHDGADIDSRPKSRGIECCWCCNEDPTWNWREMEYRIKPRPPISRKDLIDDMANQFQHMSNVMLATYHREVLGSEVQYDPDKAKFYRD